MEKFKCKNCGASDFVRKDDKYICQYCGTEYPIPEEELKKEKQNEAEESSRNAFSKSKNIPVSSRTEKTGYVDASFKKAPKKLSRGAQIAIIVIIVIAVASIVSIFSSSDFDEEADNTTVMIETETIKATEQTEASITEKETEHETHSIEPEPIDNFEYEISDNEIVLKSYHGDNDFLEISPTYTLNDIVYNTNLTSFEIGYHNFKTIIFDEGITELNMLVFNGTCTKRVYLPSTLTYIYDETLSYVHKNRNSGIVKIYYGGTEEQWNNIFTEYQRTSVGDAESAAELGKALADAVNELIEDGYDSSKYEYFFNVSLDDLKK